MGGETSRMSQTQPTHHEANLLATPRCPTHTNALRSTTSPNSSPIPCRQRSRNFSKGVSHSGPKDNPFVLDGDKENWEERAERRSLSGEAARKKRGASQLEIVAEPWEQTPTRGKGAAEGTPGNRWPIPGVADDVLTELGTLTLLNLGSDQGFPYGAVSSGVTWRVDFSECFDKMEELGGGNGEARAARMPRRFVSQMFKLHAISGRLVWRLMWVPKDHDDETLSLYLECMSCIPTESPLVRAQFGFYVGTIADAQLELNHTYASRSAVWGVQRLVRLEDLPKFERGSSLTLEMQMKWCRDTLLFPRRVLTLSESQPEMYIVSFSPRIILVENFLTMAECEQVISVARPLVKRSRVSTGNETPSRTSSSMFFTRGLEEHPVAVNVETKISQLIAMGDVHQGRTFEKSEALQAVHYHPGQFYSEHFDNKAGYSHLRAATVLCYLRDVDSGGATYFPKATGVVGRTSSSSGSASSNKASKRRKGIRVYPKRGRAIIFWSRRANGEEDTASLHAGEPIIKGEKWIVTRWLKEIDAPMKTIACEE